MTGWMRKTAAAAGVVAMGTVAAGAAGSALWSRGSARLAARMMDGLPPPDAAPYAPEELAGLPAPVRRYFAYALTPGQRRVRSARVRQTGGFQTAPGAGWKPFRATQRFAVPRPGFVWDASIKMMPGLPARVRDSYVLGRGRMYGRLGGIVPIVNQAGTREMNEASLQRWLAEAAWIPTALLPRAGVHWTALDDTTARATLIDGDTFAAVDFVFGAEGEIAGTRAERWRDVDGTPAKTLWVGRFWNYATVDGMRIPMDGEIGWELPEGRFPYWRGHVERIEYEN